MTSRAIAGDDTGVSAYGLIQPGTIAASGTGLKPAIDFLDMLTTPAGVQGHCGGLGWASAISPHRSGSDRSILSEVNHRLESRMREIRRPVWREGGRTTASPYPYIRQICCANSRHQVLAPVAISAAPVGNLRPRALRSRLLRLSSLIPLRADIAGGDYRALYLAWLLCAQGRELHDATEPPCPPGLSTLSAPLQAFADFLRIDNDLIEVAATGSPPLIELGLGEDFQQWVSVLPDSEKTPLLVNLAKGSESHVRAQLLRRFRAAVEGTGHAGTSPPQPRTVTDLLALARRHGEERRRKEAERQARERARREREAAAAREKYLAGLAHREAELWAKVDALIATKCPGDYDQAVQLLKDLWDLGIRSGHSTEIQAHVHQLQDQHVKKPSFLRRLAQCGLTPLEHAVPLARQRRPPGK